MDNNEFFKAVDTKKSTSKSKIGFFKGIVVPFTSGILGTILVIELFVKVPYLKDRLFNYLNDNITVKTTGTTKSNDNHFRTYGSR